MSNDKPAEYLKKLKKWGEEVGSKLSPSEIKEIYFDENISQRVLVFSACDEDRYFDASTSEKTLAAFLRVLWERYDKDAPGPWFDARQELTERRQEAGIEVPDFTEEQISNLPASLQKIAKERFKAYKDNSAVMDATTQYLTLVVHALDEKDGELAYLALREDRANFRRAFNFRYMEKVDPLPVAKILIPVCAGCETPYRLEDAKKVLCARMECDCPCGITKSKFLLRKPWNVELPKIKRGFDVPPTDSVPIDAATRAMAKIINEPTTGDQA